MTDQDMALWIQVKTDYVHARLLAYKIWGDDLANDPAVCNAITATLLIHHKDLSKQERIHVKVSPASVPGDAREAPQSVGEIPSQCPACSGPVWDNRTNKRSPKAPDWKCKNKECVDAKGFVTGGWVKESLVMQKAKAEGAKVGVAAGRNFNEKPGPLVEEELDQDLPF